MKNLEELKKEYLGKEIRLLELEGVGEYSLDYIFYDSKVFNLELGTYNKRMQGCYSFKDGETEFNFIFHTVGNWNVVDNSQCSNIYLTKIDSTSVKIKITDIDII